MKKRFYDGDKKDTIIGLSKLDCTTLDVLSEETGYSKSAVISAAILMITQHPEEFAEAMNTKKLPRNTMDIMRSYNELGFSFVKYDGSYRDFIIKRWVEFYNKASKQISIFDVPPLQHPNNDVSTVNQKDIDATKKIIRSNCL